MMATVTPSMKPSLWQCREHPSVVCVDEDQARRLHATGATLVPYIRADMAQEVFDQQGRDVAQQLAEVARLATTHQLRASSLEEEVSYLRSLLLRSTGAMMKYHIAEKRGVAQGLALDQLQSIATEVQEVLDKQKREADDAATMAAGILGSADS